jgi:elongation factor G
MDNISNGRRVAGPRLIALVGPFQSGKTTLLESLLARAGALARPGNVRDGSTVGDASAEARAHFMSVEANVASADYLGDRYTFVDCPGSIEFAQDMRNVLAICDAAIVVCEADPRKVAALQVILRDLEELKIPRMIFLNKIDANPIGVREALEMLQPASRANLLLRQIPIFENGIATGFIDLALERAFVYREHAPSSVIDLPSDEITREKEARYSMLERLADYDDALLEELVGDIEPPRDQVFDDLARELRDGLAVPVFIGAAEHGNGVTRLWKALRHEAPGIMQTRERLAVTSDGAPVAHVFRTIHTAHGGKLSVARVLRGAFADGQTIVSPRGEEERIAGLSRVMGATSSKQPKAEEGDTLAFGRLDRIMTGDAIRDAKQQGEIPAIPILQSPEPVHAFALVAKDRKDEVRLTAAVAKLCEEDTSLVFTQDAASGEMRLAGQGEMHLRVALERLADRFGVLVTAKRPGVAYRETIRDGVTVRGRHKKQSGGHGQFGDVVLDIGPRARGEGFVFAETVHGGTVPKQYFSSVEAGARDGLTRGPLGFPVVDVQVVLFDGQYHSVDSSDQAFITAVALSMREGMPKCDPVLLEPICKVAVTVPNEFTSRVQRLVQTRRGQILGYDAREGWSGWDEVSAMLPQSEMHDLIIELRSATQGVGTFDWTFDHLAELTGKSAEKIVARARPEEAKAKAAS